MRARFKPGEEQAIIRAIEQAEQACSGQIRVHIESKCAGADPLKRAIEVFQDLGMANTELRNGVLVYVALDDHLLSIIGDQGINDKVGAGFWDNVKETMLISFRKGEITEGICQAVLMAGEKLASFFPKMHNGSDELSNDVSFGD